MFVVFFFLYVPRCIPDFIQSFGHSSLTQILLRIWCNVSICFPLYDLNISDLLYLSLFTVSLRETFVLYLSWSFIYHLLELILHLHTVRIFGRTFAINLSWSIKAWVVRFLTSFRDDFHLSISTPYSRWLNFDRFDYINVLLWNR